VRAAIRFVVVAGLLLYPWPGIGGCYCGAVDSVATALVDPLFDASNVTFVLRAPRPQESLPEWRGVIDVKQDFPEGPVRHAGAIDLRRAGFLQLATFLALAVALPPRGRRQTIVAFGVAAGVVSFLIALPILEFLMQASAIHLWGWLDTLITVARRALVGAPGMAYAIPGLAWVAATHWESLALVAQRPA
jgi:hypothetical protein